jgi:hypothetical protein
MNNENNTDLLDKLRKHLESITPEEFNKHIEEFKDMGDITMGEFVNSLEDAPPSYEDAFEKDVCIHFAKWIAPSWMGIWVEDKWMWECLDEDMPKEHMGYKTDEELYELYLKSI